MSELKPAQITSYSFEVSLAASPSKAWDLLVNHINEWWMSDFRVLGENSIVTLDATAGGQLLEKNDTGAALEWYRVQMCQPGEALHLIGQLAPDWGGPTTSMMKLAISKDNAGSKLIVSDALLGVVSQKSLESAKSGWALLFGTGFKTLADQ